MTIKSFFSRPGSSREIQERIKLDIRFAKQYLYIAQYNLTDEYIIKEIIKSKAIDKRIIVNHQSKANLINIIKKY